MKGHMVSNEIPITFCAFETVYAEPLGTTCTWSIEQMHERAVDKTREHANSI